MKFILIIARLLLHFKAEFIHFYAYHSTLSAFQSFYAIISKILKCTIKF